MSDYTIEDAKRDIAALHSPGSSFEWADDAQDRLLAFIKQQAEEIEQLRDEVGAYLPDMMGDLKNITSLHVDRDRWKAKAEWLAIHLAAADSTEPLWKWSDWLQAAEEATK